MGTHLEPAAEIARWQIGVSCVGEAAEAASAQGLGNRPACGEVSGSVAGVGLDVRAERYFELSLGERRGGPLPV